MLHVQPRGWCFLSFFPIKRTLDVPTEWHEDRQDTYNAGAGIVQTTGHVIPLKVGEIPLVLNHKKYLLQKISNWIVLVLKKNAVFMDGCLKIWCLQIHNVCSKGFNKCSCPYPHSCSWYTYHVLQSGQAIPYIYIYYLYRCLWLEKASMNTVAGRQPDVILWSSGRVWEDALHGIPESDLFPYATTLHPRACPLLAETLSGTSAWCFAKGDIWYDTCLYIYICVCERNNKKRCWLLLLQTQSVLNLACLARNRYMAIHEHRCTYCLPNISGFNFKMHGKLQGLCWPCRSHSHTS